MYVLFPVNILQEENNFCDILLAAMDRKVVPKHGKLLKKGNCSQRRQFFFLKIVPIEKEGKNENDSVASPNSIELKLNKIYLTKALGNKK